MALASAIRVAIEAANAQFVAAFKRGDAAGVAQCYTETAQALPPQSDVLSGRPAIQAMWQGVMSSGVKAATLKTVEVVDFGNTAYEVGEWALAGESGQALDHGKYIVIWQREDGKWKLHRDIWNTSRA